MEKRHWALAFGAVAAAAAIAHLWALRAFSARSAVPLDRDRLIVVLRALAHKWYNACREVAEMSRTVRQKLLQQNQQVGQEEFSDQILNHCGVRDKLEEIQCETLEEFGLTQAQVEGASTTHAEDSVVKAYNDGFEQMLKDAIAGKSPILPNTVIPKDLNEDKALAMAQEMQEMEIKQVCEHFEKAGGFLPSVQALGTVLAMANKEAEQKVIGSSGYAPEVFHTAVAQFSRHSPDFVRRKAEVDMKHRDRMVKMFKPQGSSSRAA